MTMIFGNNITLAAASAEGAPNTASMWLTFIPLILMFVLMYFMLIRPQSKKRKAEDKMRNELQIGDEVTTIGGIVGRVVSIKEDTNSLVLETGADRGKIQIKKWAIASCDTIHDDASVK